MKSHHVLFASLILALPAATVVGQAPVPLQFAMRESLWTVTGGLRAGSGGGDVKFGNLGTVPALVALDPLGQATPGRLYDNGVVITDAARLNERAGGVADGEVISTPGGRYTVTSTDSEGVTTVVGDYLSYTPGQTRSWSYTDASQVTGDGRIAMSQYSATSEGATAEADGDAAGGVELGLGRRLGKIGNRFEWGVSGMIGLTDINSKARGKVASTLRTVTDYYSLLGATAPTAPYAGPTFDDLKDAEGNVISVGGFETTTPIGDTPLERVESALAGGAEIDGFWQIKGAYYLIRVGPHMRTRIGNRMALYASAGFAGAYVGTTYRVEEVLNVGTASVRAEEERDQSEFISGFYGELSAEFWLTNRTGFFAGATYHTLGSYEQAINGRTANIDLGKGAGFRLGIVTRF